jgi:hypothetical protein
LILASRGDATVGPELAAIAIGGADRGNRVVAVESLTHLASCELISIENLDGIVETLNEDSRDSYERSRIVEALGFLPGDLVSAALEQQLASWAGGRDELALRSLETLARQGRLTAHPDLLANRLGLRRAGTRWDLVPTTSHAGNIGFVLGLLYEHDPERFVEAVCLCVRDFDWIDAAGLLHFFGGLGGSQRQVPNEVKDALIDRIRSRQSRTSAETELFEILGQWDGEALVSQPWGLYWDDWLPDARAAFADAMGDLGPEVRDRAVAHLLALTRDGMYAVRRSAYRSLGCISGESLVALCRACAFVEVPSGEVPAPVELRRRGAEACSWLSDDQFTSIFEQFSYDPDRTVRETAFRMRSERQIRINSHACLSAVLSVNSGDTDEMLSSWRFGRALSLRGDDFCIRAIRKHLHARRLPPNVRHWLGQIMERIESNWTKVTQKWPEPWLAWEGAIEENRGKVILPGNDQVSVKYTLWLQPRLTSSRVGNWRGAAWSPDGSVIFDFGLFNAILVLADGRRGNIAVTVNSINQIQFVGNGPIELCSEPRKGSGTEKR